MKTIALVIFLFSQMFGGIAQAQGLAVVMSHLAVHAHGGDDYEDEADSEADEFDHNEHGNGDSIFVTHTHSHQDSPDGSEHEHSHQHEVNIGCASNFVLITEYKLDLMAEPGQQFSTFEVRSVQSPCLNSLFRPPIV